MKSLPPLPLIDGCLFIDNSGWVEGMSTCYRSLQYKSLNLRISTGEKPSLNFGSAIHLALEYRYSMYGNRPVDEEYYFEVTTLLTDFFAEHPPEAEDWRNLNWAMTVLRKYNEKYDIEGFSLLSYDSMVKCPHCNGKGQIETIDQSDGHREVDPCFWCKTTGTRLLMVELPFAHKFHLYQNGAIFDSLTPDQKDSYLRHSGIPVMYSGRIDLPLSLDDHLYVLDHKTTGMLGNQFWDGMRMTSQQRGYVWAFQELTGKKVSGYMINAIRTKEPPQYVTNGKTSAKGKSQSPESWWDESLSRERFLIKPNEIVEWKNNTLDLVEEFFWHYSRDYMPQKTTWCTSYGRCPYYDVCQLSSEDRGLLLASGQYADNIWSPLNKIQPTQSKQ